MHRWRLIVNRDILTSRGGTSFSLLSLNSKIPFTIFIVKKKWVIIIVVIYVANIAVQCSFSTSHLLFRFAKLLLRLPALRSIGLKCLEHLFFFKLIGDTPIDTFLMEMLEAPHQLT